MSRSCQSATFSRPRPHCRAGPRARPAIRSQVIGLRLCGIALEPFCPSLNGSSTSRTSVRWRWRISSASRSSEAPASAIAFSSSACRSRGTTWVDSGSGRRSEPGQRLALDLGIERRVGADGARELADGDLLERAPQPPRAAVALEGEARQLEAEGRRLGVHAVRAPDADRVAELARPVDEHVGQRCGARRELPPRLSELKREAGVEHVGRGEPVVDPPAGIADRLAPRRRRTPRRRGR